MKITHPLCFTSPNKAGGGGAGGGGGWFIASNSSLLDLAPICRAWAVYKCSPLVREGDEVMYLRNAPLSTETASTLILSNRTKKLLYQASGGTHASHRSWWLSWSKPLCLGGDATTPEPTRTSVWCFMIVCPPGLMIPWPELRSSLCRFAGVTGVSCSCLQEKRDVSREHWTGYKLALGLHSILQLGSSLCDFIGCKHDVTIAWSLPLPIASLLNSIVL